MNDKFSVKNPDGLKTEIKKLISFEEKDDLLKPSRIVTDDNTGDLKLLSKYRTVLSCSFVTDTKDAASVERIGAEQDQFS